MQLRIAASSRPTGDTKYSRANALTSETLRVFCLHPYQVYRALSRRGANFLRNGVLLCNRDHQVNVVGHQMPPLDLALLIPDQLRNTFPRYCRDRTYNVFLWYFGMTTMWYFHTACCGPGFGARPSMELHARVLWRLTPRISSVRSQDIPPQTSIFYCLFGQSEDNLHRVIDDPIIIAIRRAHSEWLGRGRSCAPERVAFAVAACARRSSAAVGSVG